uniref:C2H2-type domain-containing protein n=1 Tax=Anopheles maculatus TaxID=74869 RepID=A0A182T439_9DIPT
MSTEETVERSELETVDAVAVPVFKKDAICKDVNENMVLCCGEASSNSNCSQSYVQAYTSFTLEALRGPKFYCFECEYYLHTLLSMITHMKMHRKPFCPICFRMFAHESEVNAHTAAVHPKLFSNVDSNSFVPLGEEDSSFSMEVPPNSPTQEHQGCGELQNRSISFLLAQKLRKHQAMLNRAIQSEAQKVTARRAVSADEKAIRGAGKASNIHRASGKARLAGKVHKRSKSKPAAPTKAAKGGEESADNSLRRLTSRFGRAISLKVPQF